MPEYRRLRLEGGMFFFTVVAFGRRPILTTERGLRCLRHAWRQTCATHPFETEAVCVLPDHLHVIWTLPEKDDDYPTRWRKIKGLFTREFRKSGGAEGARSLSRRSKDEAAVWQRRYWEHRIRDTEDFNRHVNYIHFNPVKHGHVGQPADWSWSSFHEHVANGWIEPDWGVLDPLELEGLDVGE